MCAALLSGVLEVLVVHYADFRRFANCFEGGKLVFEGREDDVACDIALDPR
ncbi:MAG TPA: hypothetical protein PLV25_00545 [Opitutales bacterium]|nr:hypothetical protein [Opitutales bacterium]